MSSELLRVAARIAGKTWGGRWAAAAEKELLAELETVELPRGGRVVKVKAS